MAYLACYGVSGMFNTLSQHLQYWTSPEAWRVLAESEGVSTKNVERQRCYYELRSLAVDQADTCRRETYQGLSQTLPATIEVTLTPDPVSGAVCVQLTRTTLVSRVSMTPVVRELIELSPDGTATHDARRYDSDAGCYSERQAFTPSDQDLTLKVREMTDALLLCEEAHFREAEQRLGLAA